MKIIIAGAGDVGSHLAKMLSNENHEIVLIDVDDEKLKEIGSSIDLKTIEGSATSITSLNAAGISKADLFIAVTHSEQININAAILCKKLGSKKCLARIDNLEYLENENHEYFTSMGIDYMFYPEQLAATEIVELMQQSGTSDIVSFAGGKLYLYVLKIDEETPNINVSFDELQGIKKELEYKVVAITRNNETFIPTGKDKIQSNDLVYVVTTPKGVDSLLNFFGKKAANLRNIMVLGGSRIGKHTAKQLGKTHTVKLIERDRTKSYDLSNELHGTLVINADGRNVDLLMQEGLAYMDAFIAVTGNSETNMISCLLAKKMGVTKTIAEIENTEYIKLAENMGIDTIINKKMITASRIFKFTMSEDVSAVKCLTGTSAEVFEYVAKPESKVTQGPISEIDFPDDAMIGGLVRGKNTIVVTDETEIRPFDRVVVFALPTAINKVGKYFNSQNRFF
jgi:trk system potassium uptake protein